MTASIVPLSATSSAERTTFLERFIGTRADDERSPSIAYVRMVVDVALTRNAELFLAFDAGEPVGRAAIVAAADGRGTASLGLFEIAIGRHTTHRTGRRLIDTACEWARGRGLTEVYAPVDINSWFNYRFLVPPEGENLAVAPYPWEPARPEAYLALFREAGFEDAEWYRTVGAEFDERSGSSMDAPVRYTAKAFDAAVAAGYGFQRVGSAAELAPLLGEMHALCSAAFADNLLFEPLPLDVFRRLYGSAAAARDCSLTHTARDPAGRLAGFVFAFVDDGAVVIKTIAVIPEERGKRLSTALTHLVLTGAADRGHRKLISALVRRGNTSEFLSRPHLVPGLATWTHEYVLLRRMVSR